VPALKNSLKEEHFELKELKTWFPSICWSLLFGGIIGCVVLITTDWPSATIESSALAWLCRFAVAGLCAILLRLVVIVAMRHSISMSVNIAKREIIAFQPDVLVGFSWGGAIAAFLMSRGLWAAETVMLSPSLKPMCRFAWLGIPRPPQADLASSTHIFLPNMDKLTPGWFEFGINFEGCKLHTLRDGHDLCQPKSISEIVRCVRELSGDVIRSQSEMCKGSNSGTTPLAEAEQPSFQTIGNLN